MYKLEEITQVHLEITEHCQAACPMCPRMHMGQVNANLTMSELTLEDCKKIFEPSFLKQLNNIYLCGNYGDPIVAKELLEILRYFREQNPTLYLNIHTNGGARNSEWWVELAQILNKRGGVVFGVDGLKDTNHLYRKNVNWDILMNSITSFIAAGGIAEWQYIVFDHNQHQVQEAEQLSKDWGFKKFFLVRTNRFIQNLESEQSVVDVFNKKGDKVSNLKRPAEEYQNVTEKKKESILEKFGSADNYYKNTEIVCKAKAVPKIFISAEGLMLPCCWLGGDMYHAGTENRRENQIWKIIDSLGGKETLNAKNGLQASFDSGLLEIVEDSWNKHEFSEGRLKTCARLCCKEYDTMTSQRQQ